MEGLDKAKEKALSVSVRGGSEGVTCVMCVIGAGGGEGEPRHGQGDPTSRGRDVTPN